MARSLQRSSRTAFDFSKGIKAPDWDLFNRQDNVKVDFSALAGNFQAS
jgi:hypothetical protein